MVEGIGDAGDGEKTTVDQDILTEQDRADKGQVTDAGDRQGRQFDPRQAGEILADQPGQAQAQQGQGEPGGDLIGDQTLRQDREQQRHGQAGDRAAGDPDQRRTGDLGASEGANRPHHHHALDAKVEHPGPFDHQFADGRQQQRRGGGDDGQDDGFERAHG